MPSRTRLLRRLRRAVLPALSTAALVALPGCKIGTVSHVAAPPSQAGAAGSGAAAPVMAPGARPVFVDGQAQIVAAFADSTRWIRHDLWVETEIDSDGSGRPDRVHVSVTRPAETETEDLRVPVIYESSPYYSGVGTTDPRHFWDIRHAPGDVPPMRQPMPSIVQQVRRPRLSGSHVNEWVPRGFAVVHSASPGTGLSEGCPTVGGVNESLAPKAVIDWLNGRARGFSTPDGEEEVRAEWSTGRVGMTGTSYGGTLALAAATTGVEGLEAIIPVAPNTSYYHYYRSNGLVRSPGGWPGEDIDVLFDYINSGNPERRDHCIRTVRDGEMADGQDRLTGDYNDFWAGRDYLPRVGRVRAATLLAHAFNDWNVMPEHSVRIYEALRAQGTPAQVYFHQGGHGGAPPLERMNRWFTRYLHGVQNGVELDPRAWIVREGDARLEPSPYLDFPNPDARMVRLHPEGGGAGVGRLTRIPSPSRRAESLVDNASFSGGVLAAAERTDHRLLYATPPLTEPLHISGTPRVEVRVAVDRSAANLSVWLVTLPWRGSPEATESVVTRGWADPRNHTSIRRSQPLEPHRYYELTFDLQPTDKVVPAGRRLALMIFSSDREFTLRPEPGTELTVDLGGTSIRLPVVGGDLQLERALGIAAGR